MSYASLDGRKKTMRAVHAVATKAMAVSGLAGGGLWFRLGVLSSKARAGVYQLLSRPRNRDLMFGIE